MKINKYDGAEYGHVEIYVAGDKVDELADSLDDFGDNPAIVSLFNPSAYSSSGEYQGDGCNVLEIKQGVLRAAIDGLDTDSVIAVSQDCIKCASANPSLSYLVVGIRTPDNEDDKVICDVLLCQGFNSSNNPIPNFYGKFYDKAILRGI